MNYYKKAYSYLENRRYKSKKIKHRTYLGILANNVVGDFWNTGIVTITPNNIISLNSGGYRTPTTKQRMNLLLNMFDIPYLVSQKNYIWYVTLHDDSYSPIRTVKFYDGMILNDIQKYDPLNLL